MEFDLARFILALLFLFISQISTAYASNSGITYQGRIFKPDGSPLSGANTQFKLQIRTPDANNCLMYEEVQSLDLRNSSGIFSLTINDGTGSRTDTTGFGLDRIFGNRGSFTFDPTTCSTGSSYAPNAGDGRMLAVLFKDETMTTWEPIPPAKINFVPLAFEAKQVQGFTADSLVRVVNGSGDPITGLSPLSNTQYTELLALVNGTSTNYTKTGQLNGSALPTMNSGEVLGWNGTAWVSSAAPAPGANSITTAMIQSGAVTTSQIASNVTINTSGTLGAAITTTRDFKIFAASPSTFYIDMQAPALTASYSLVWPMNAGSNGQVLTTDGAGNLSWAAAAAASQWTTHGSNISYDIVGNVGIGTTAPAYKLDVAGDVNVTGNFKVNGVNIATGSGDFLKDGSVAMTGTLKGNTGTAALPGYTFSGMTGTGVFETGTDILGFSTAGSERMRVLANGYIGIGTSSPMAKVDVTASAASGATVLSLKNTSSSGSSGLQLVDSSGNVQSGIEWANASFPVSSVANSLLLANANSSPIVMSTNGTERLRVTGAGNVGIGTTSPGYSLDVAGDVNVTGNFKVNGVNIATGGGDFMKDGSVAMTGALPAAVGTKTAPGYTFSGDTNTGLYHPSADAIGIVTGGADAIRVTSAGDVGVGTTAPGAKFDVGGLINTSAGLMVGGWGAVNRSTTLDINQTSGAYGVAIYPGSSGNAAVYVQNGTGYVGIGTTSPTALFDAAGAVYARGSLTSGSSGSPGLLALRGSANQTVGVVAVTNSDNQLDVQQNTNGGFITFSTFNTSLSEKMRITSAGDVGIGTTSPAYKLDVAGAINATALKINGVDVSSGGGGATAIDGLSDAITNYTNNTMFLGNNTGTNVTGSASAVTVLGSSAAPSLTSATDGTFVGFAAGNGVSTQASNTAIGSSALYGLKNASSNNNTAVGHNALFSNTTGIGTDNTGIGKDAGSQGSGDYNVFVGSEAGNTPGTASNSVAIGYSAGSGASGNSNVMLGRYAGADSTGADNVLIGDQVLFTNGTSSTGAQNVIIGSQAAGNNNQHNLKYNVAIGYGAVNVVTTGQYNTILGYQAGNTLTTGSRNILIGQNIQVPTATRNDFMNIGGLIGGDLANGYVGIGTTSPVATLDIKGNMHLRGSTSGYVGLQAAAAAGSTTYTLPSADGTSGQFLKTDGAGTLSWASASGGTGDFMKDGSVAMTGPIKLPDGTAAAPAMTFSSETGTGLYRSSASEIAFALGGTTAFKVLGGSSVAYLSSGKARFSTGTVSAPTYGFQNDTSTGIYGGTGVMGFSIGGAAKMYIDATGQVGIGTTSPGYKLDVSGSMNATQVCIAGTCKSSWPSGGTGDFMKDGSVAMTGQFQAVAGSMSVPGISFASDTNSGFYSPFNDEIDMTIGGSQQGYFNSGNFIWFGDNWSQWFKGTGGSASIPSFRTNTAGDNAGMYGIASDVIGFSTASTERMRIDASGNVGIGTTSPSYKLDVGGQVNVANNSYVSFGGFGALNSGTAATTKLRANTSQGLSFVVNSGTVAQTIDTNGLVGIGTTAPGESLTVVGSSNSNDYGSGHIRVQNTSNTAVGTGSFVAMADNGSFQTAMGHTATGYTNYTGMPGNSGYLTTLGAHLVVGAGLASGDVRLLTGGLSSTNERMRIDSSGNVGIGTTAPGEMLEVAGSVKATSFITSSDRRLKRDIRPVEGWEAIKRLNGVRYVLKSTDSEELGVIAQDVEQVFPEVVVTNPQTGYKAVKYQSLISPLIEAVKDTHQMCEDRTNQLQARVDKLEKENQDLKSKYDSLRGELDEIKKSLSRMPTSQGQKK